MPNVRLERTAVPGVVAVYAQVVSVLYGFKEIRSYLKSAYGFAPSRETFWQLRRRKKDPFPCADKLVAHRQRLHATVARVDAWVKRNAVPGGRIE